MIGGSKYFIGKIDCRIPKIASSQNKPVASKQTDVGRGATNLLDILYLSSRRFQAHLRD